MVKYLRSVFDARYEPQGRIGTPRRAPKTGHKPTTPTEYTSCPQCSHGGVDNFLQPPRAQILPYILGRIQGTLIQILLSANLTFFRVVAKAPSLRASFFARSEVSCCWLGELSLSPEAAIWRRGTPAYSPLHAIKKRTLSVRFPISGEGGPVR